VRLATLLVLPLATSGCVALFYDQRNAPGTIAHLDAPPADLRAQRVDQGEDPGVRGWLAHATLLGGGEMDRGPGGGTLGAELGAMPFALDKSPSRSYAFDEALSKVWIRPSIGWMFLRGEGPIRTHVGPLYGEVQATVWFSKHLGALMFGIGPRVQLAYEDAGVQSTACIGIHPAIMLMCLRGAVEANRGPELSIFVSASSFGVWWWSK
jgi:hypothetical protein